MRSPTAWQMWFKRRQSKFAEEVLAARAGRGQDASTKPDIRETAKTQPQDNADDERVDSDHGDGNEDANAVVEYLLMTPCKSKEKLTAYWEGFRSAVGFTRPISVPDTEIEVV